MLTRPENLNGSQSFNFSGTVGIPLKKVTTGRRSPVNLNLTFFCPVWAGCEARSWIRLVSIIPAPWANAFSFNYFIQDKLDLQANANFNYNNANFTTGSATDYKYFDQHYSIDVTYTIFKRIMFNNDLIIM